MSTETEQAFFKILIVGDGAVGKTSICTQVTSQEFFSDYNLTIGCDFFIKRMYIDDISVTLQIFDLGGQDQFLKVRGAFAGGAKGIFLAYDITRRDSFYNLEDWYNSVKQELDSKAPKILLATKNDLNELSEVWKEDIDTLLSKLHIDGYFETSAYQGIGIEEAFIAMGKFLLARYEKEDYSKDAQRDKFLEGFYRSSR